MKRLREPAFNEKNRYFSLWVVTCLALFVAYFNLMYPDEVMVSNDPDRGLAVADARLRDTAWKRMEEACFTRKEIKDYWYKQGFWEYPNRLLVIIRGREKLCGGRGLCGCKAKEKRKGSV